MYLGTVKSAHVISFLRHLLGRTHGKILLFWDGGPIHRAKVVKEFLQENRNRIEERRLPPYAPDINPTEQVYKRLKYVETANNCPTSISELMRETRAALERIRKRSELVPSFFEHAGLSLTGGRG